MPYVDREKRLAYSKKYNRETREWAKKNGICVVCCKQKADEGYATCLQCRMANRERPKRPRNLTADKIAERKNKHAQRRLNLIEQGICTQCGKRKTNGYQICDVCRAKINARRREKYSEGKEIPIILYGESGKCSLCGKPTYANHKLCKFHYDVAVQNLGKVKNRGSETYRKTNQLFFKRKGADK